ncbi:tyrosine-type recombinase/integrase [Aliiruegeria lutimaris]|uniref:Site-specific recombinase XerD n=1 Tax=Aliiruegeria lutimaris TaxID=571298 RepID=A0A1G9ET15_9RHOB|nr:site-specific integrase [Aliiruegeria lutimaris]SDK79306.1 Site-specific recombinase XerD [Aliiruegeria lutimaris]
MASIYQARKDGGWTAQVNLGGKRRSKTFPKQADAKRWARQQEATIDTKGARVRTVDDTRLNDLIQCYLTECIDVTAISRSKESTIRHISELLGRARLSDLTVARYQDFAKERTAEGAGSTTIGQDLTYIHTILKTAGPLLDAPYESALGNYHAARRILSMSGKVTRSEERDRRPSDSELLQLREQWAKRRRVVPMWDITLFAISTAMRLSEITRIRWDDLDEDNRTVVIRDRKHPRSKKGNDQTVPLLCGPAVIGGETVDPIALIQRQVRTDAEIFPYDSGTISTSFTRGVAACGIEGLRFHDLRHDGVSRLFEAGYDIPQVSLVSGHESWSNLKRYTNLRPESLHRD